MSHRAGRLPIRADRCRYLSTLRAGADWRPPGQKIKLVNPPIQQSNILLTNSIIKIGKILEKAQVYKLVNSDIYAIFSTIVNLKGIELMYKTYVRPSGGLTGFIF